MSMMDVIEEEYENQIHVLKTALTNAVSRLWKCSQIDICEGCNSDCYKQQLQKQCGVYISEAEVQINEQNE